MVDDNQINQLLGESRLEQWSCKVGLADNRLESIKMLEQKLYNVILMDIQIPIISMSATTTKYMIKKVSEAGIDGYVF